MEKGRCKIQANYGHNFKVLDINKNSIDDNYCYTNGDGKLTIGIDILDLNSRRKGYATEAWSLYIKYILDSGIDDIYTQTWSGNIRVIGLMKKLGFFECNREKGLRIVSGELYDGLTFKLNIKKYDQFIKEHSIINKEY
ncbi:MAG: GNAT family protein [Tissierellia bacterium]|nr:GNAT family protein [Tissierellia bacterium]